MNTTKFLTNIKIRENKLLCILFRQDAVVLFGNIYVKTEELDKAFNGIKLDIMYKSKNFNGKVKNLKHRKLFMRKLFYLLNDSYIPIFRVALIIVMIFKRKIWNYHKDRLYTFIRSTYKETPPFVHDYINKQIKIMESEFGENDKGRTT